MNIYEQIREVLVDAARNEGHVTYGKLAGIAGLDMELSHERAKLGEILGTISSQEHENGRPLLSVVAWFANSPEPSKGFYNLAESLGVYSKKQDKDSFFIEELKKTYQYWARS